MHNKALTKFSIGSALLILIGISQARTLNTTTELLNDKSAVEYVFSRPMLQAMYQLGVNGDRHFNLQADCKSQYQVKPVTATVLKPVEFLEGKSNPTSGVWLTRYQLERCGDSKVYNAMFVASADGEAPTSKAYFPGSTHTSLLLMNDALPQAVNGAIARAALKDCKQAEVFDMRVSQDPHDVTEGGKTFKRVWNELWTFKICDQMIDVDMTFVPDAEGGGAAFITGDAKTRDPAPP